MKRRGRKKKMSTNTTDTHPITTRFITCGQSKGSLGNSTVADMLLGWLHFAGVPFAAIDADLQHKTLSKRYPLKEVRPTPVTESQDSFGVMLSTLPAKPVLLMDRPAQATDKLLAYAQHYQMLAAFKEAGIRMTLLVFCSDNADAIDSAVSTVEYFGDAADYLMIENSACFRSEEFQKTGLHDWLLEHNTPTVVVPRISKVSLNAWEKAEEKADRYFALADLINQPDLPFVAKLELSGVRNRMLVQFEDCAAVLLPDPELIKNRVSREPKNDEQKPVSRFRNPLVMKK